jgi:hypothetical protein
MVNLSRMEGTQEWRRIVLGRACPKPASRIVVWAVGKPGSHRDSIKSMECIKIWRPDLAPERIVVDVHFENC